MTAGCEMDILERALAENARLSEALIACAQVFEHYAEIHAEKEPSVINQMKVERNKAMVQKCYDAINGVVK